MTNKKTTTPIPKCNYCNQRMDKPHGENGCIVKTIEIEGVARPRIPYVQPYLGDDYKYCHDCGVTELRYHHPGCDMEICINCIGQLISCPCEITDLKEVKIPPEVLIELMKRSHGSCSCCGDEFNDTDKKRTLHRRKNEE